MSSAPALTIAPLWARKRAYWYRLGLRGAILIPWAIWRGMKKQYGRKYMLEDEAGLYEVKMQSGRVYFLDAKEGER